jgi:hypothetical protein
MTVQKDFARLSLAFLVMGMIGGTLFATSCVGQQRPPTVKSQSSLNEFLRQYLADSRFGEDKTTRYSAASANLGGDGREAVVAYISGQRWCGSGGCTLLVLEPRASSYQVVGKITIARLPITVLPSTTNGWHDIGVWVQGGGVQPGYEAALSFDGRRYTSNPSVPPARRLAEKTIGEVLIPADEKAKPLYE